MEMFNNEENSKCSIHSDDEDNYPKLEEEEKVNYPSLPIIIENHCDISREYPVTESIHISDEKLTGSFILDKTMQNYSTKYIIQEKGEVKD